MSDAEEYKLIGKTQFGLWLSKEGDSKYLGVSTKKIEAELIRLVRLARLDGEQKCIKEGKLHVTQVFLDTKIELARKEGLKSAGEMLGIYSGQYIESDRIFESKKNFERFMDEYSNEIHSDKTWTEQMTKKVEVRVRKEITKEVIEKYGMREVAFKHKEEYENELTQAKKETAKEIFKEMNSMIYLDEHEDTLMSLGQNDDYKQLRKRFLVGK